MRRDVFLLACALACSTAAAGPAAAQQDKSGLLSLDTNDDGAIGRREALTAQINTYHRLDANGDDRVSRAELAASRPAPKDAEAAEKRKVNAANQRWFDNLDRDGDAGISLAEYQAAMTPYFDRLDGNGDGVIDAAELRAAYDSGDGAGR